MKILVFTGETLGITISCFLDHTASMSEYRYRLTNDLVIVIVKNMDERTGFAFNGGLINGWTHILIRSDFMFDRLKVAHEVAKLFGIHVYDHEWSYGFGKVE